MVPYDVDGEWERPFTRPTGRTHPAWETGADAAFSLETVGLRRLQSMAAAGRALTILLQDLERSRETILDSLEAVGPDVADWQHYPAADVFDPQSQAQYYFHAHPAEERPPGEYGHFHTFLRPGGMPADIRPAALYQHDDQREADDSPSHLIGLSVDRAGRPLRLFTTNRWVTGETWYAAPDVARMLDRFSLEHARPAHQASRWIALLVQLYRPQIEWLLAARDRTVADWQARNPGLLVYDDRRLDVTSEMPIRLEEHMATLVRMIGGDPASR